jgi:hypothetical protein
LQLLTQVGLALTNPALGGKASEITGWLTLAAELARLGAQVNAERAELLAQIKAAVAEGRGLTAEERASWAARNDVVDDKMRAWLAANGGA